MSKLNNQELIHTFKGHSKSVNSVSFSPDGQYIASGSADGTIKLWNLNNQELIHIFEGHNGRVYSVSFSPDGQYIASSSRDKTIKLWDLHNQELIHTFEGHNGGGSTLYPFLQMDNISSLVQEIKPLNYGI